MLSRNIVGLLPGNRFSMSKQMKTMISEPEETGVCIRIGDITFGLTSADPLMKIGLEGDMGRFRVPSADPDLAVQASWGTLSDEYGGEKKVFDSGGAWRVHRRQGDYWFICTAPQFGRIPYKVARLDRDFRKAEIVLHRPFFNPEEAVYPLQYPLDEVLSINLLARGRGVEMHACGVVDTSGEGYLFTGESGAGKTTMARLWKKERGVSILSDDRIILRQDRGRIWMYGTPWHGEENLASPDRAPLKAVYFLRHGPRNMVTAIAGAKAAAWLYARSFPVFYNPDALQYTLEFYGKLTGTVPCYELYVIPNKHVIDLVRNI